MTLLLVKKKVIKDWRWRSNGMTVGLQSDALSSWNTVIKSGHHNIFNRLCVFAVLSSNFFCEDMRAILHLIFVLFCLYPSSHSLLSSTPPSFSLSPSSVNWVRLGSLRSKCLSRKHPTPTSRLCCRECHNCRREGFLKERRVHTHSSFPLPPLCYSHHSVTHLYRGERSGWCTAC